MTENLPRTTLNFPELFKQVRGIKKGRDLLILLGIASGLLQQEMADKFKLAKSNISRIVRNNFDLLNKLTISSELAQKAGRLRYAFKVIQQREKIKEGYSKKDTLDWLEYIRKEIEGDKEIAPQSSPIVIILNQPKERIFPATDEKRGTTIASKPLKKEGL